MPILDFSNSDMRAIRELVRASRLGLNELLQALGLSEQESIAPEFHVARVPPSGIPALTQVGTGDDTGTGDADTPGSAVCDLYRILPDGSLERIGISKTVYNLSEITITEEWVPIARLKGGQWVAYCCTVGTGTGTGVGVPCCSICPTATESPFCCFAVELDGFATGTGTPVDCDQINETYYLDPPSKAPQPPGFPGFVPTGTGTGTGTVVCSWVDYTLCAVHCCPNAVLWLALYPSASGLVGKVRILITDLFSEETQVTWEKLFTGTGTGAPQDCAEFTEASPLTVPLKESLGCKSDSATCRVWLIEGDCPIRRCVGTGTGQDCLFCNDMPREWIVNLGDGGFTTDSCTSGPKTCADIKGEFAVGPMIDFSIIECRWIFLFEDWCTFRAADLQITFSYFNRFSPGGEAHYFITVSLAGGGGISGATYKSATWDELTNPDCLHIADDQGRIALTKQSESHTGFFPPCQGTLPETIYIYDALG